MAIFWITGYLLILIVEEGANGVTDIIKGNGHSNLSSIPGQGCLYYT